MVAYEQGLVCQAQVSLFICQPFVGKMLAHRIATKLKYIIASRMQERGSVDSPDQAQPHDQGFPGVGLGVEPFLKIHGSTL